jgi:hypothetical protein
MVRTLVLAFLLLAPPLVAQTQQGSPVVDMMIRARNALNDLRYAEADSIARRILALGNLITKQQQIDALQLRAAAAFPDEQGAQYQDSAIAIIRQLVELGATGGPPREISWPGLDSLFTFVGRIAQPAKIVIGSRVSGSVVYVDGQPQGVVQGLRAVQVPPGRPVQISIRAENCTPWDSTIVTQAADSIRVGFRSPRCSK